MYLIKRVQWQGEKIVLKNGIQVGVLKNPNKILAIHEFWGTTEFKVDENADLTKYVEYTGDSRKWLLHVNDYKVSDIGDGYKKFFFTVADKNNKEGYIFFVERLFTETLNVFETTGEKLFDRNFDEIVVVLKEGQYLKFEDKVMIVINGHLLLKNI